MGFESLFWGPRRDLQLLCGGGLGFGAADIDWGPIPTLVESHDENLVLKGEWGSGSFE